MAGKKVRNVNSRFIKNVKNSVCVKEAHDEGGGGKCNKKERGVVIFE